ncbi:MAG: response regulator [Vampirovibrionia bacterium]
MTTYNILIVDDDSVIKESLVNYLTRFHKAGYKLKVDSAETVKESKELLNQKDYNLAIIDINMPNESGFDLIEAINKNYPKTKTALITAYKVEDYLKLCRDKGVSNIIVKTAPFNFKELSYVINGLLEPDKYLFGIHNYLNSETEVQSLTINSSNSLAIAQATIRDCMSTLKVNNLELLSIALLEAMTNALYHAPHNSNGTKKYDRDIIIQELTPDEIVEIHYGWDEEKLGISITDHAGKLNKDNVLYWLNRNVTGANILDSTGRGLYLMHSIVDRLIININPDVKTEIIFLIYLKEIFSGHKPIYINQI